MQGPIVKTSTLQKPVNGSEKKPINAKLEQLSPTNPLPFERGKGFSPFTNANYLPFLSSDDNYAKLLLQARLLSNTHNACVTTKKDYCAGNGFQTIDEQDIKDKKFNDWLKYMNLQDESVVEINQQIFDSFFTYGNVPIELVRYSIGKKKYLYIYVHDFLEWRLGEPDENGFSQYAIQSKMFLRDSFVLTQEDIDKSRVLPLYSPRKGAKVGTNPVKNSRINWVRDSNGTERTMIWYKNAVSGFKNYGLPSAIAGLIYQQLEYHGARFNLDNFENDMVVSAILALKGNVGETEVNKIGKKVVNAHTGTGKRGRVMVVGSEQGIEGSDFHPFETHREGSYKESDEVWVQKIIMANQWDSTLAGIVTSRSLGKGMGYLTKIIEVKKNTVMVPAQNHLMNKFWVKVLDLSKAWLGFNIEPDKIQIKNSIDISGLTDVDITPAVTVDEVRQAKGLPKSEDKEKGKKFLGELGADQKKGVYVKDKNSKKGEPDVQEE